MAQSPWPGVSSQSLHHSVLPTWNQTGPRRAGPAASLVSGLPKGTGLFWHLPPLSWSPSCPTALHNGANSVLLPPPGTVGNEAGCQEE